MAYQDLYAKTFSYSEKFSLYFYTPIFLCAVLATATFSMSPTPVVALSGRRCHRDRWFAEHLLLLSAIAHFRWQVALAATFGIVCHADNVTSAATLAVFRKRLKTYLFRSSYNVDY